MIHLEITSGPDQNAMSSYQYFQNQIYLGRSSGDLHINDKNILPAHVMLEVIEKDLIIHPQKGVEFFLLNGKRASAIRKLKPNDSITIGETTIKIIQFEETVILNKKDILDTKLDSLINQNSPRLNVVEKLTKLMKS